MNFLFHNDYYFKLLVTRIATTDGNHGCARIATTDGTDSNHECARIAITDSRDASAHHFLLKSCSFRFLDEQQGRG